MEFGVVTLSIVPVRSQPSDKSEMVTQLLFGELVVINRKFEQWLNIRIVYDNYEGWIDAKQINKIDEEEFNQLKNSEAGYVTDVVDVIENSDSGRMIPVVLGSKIYANENQEFTLGGEKFIFSGIPAFSGLKATWPGVLETAMLFINAPYLWGGKTPFGIDCSGFTQMVYKINGIQIQRDASQQA